MDDRRIISGIFFVLQTGCAWDESPQAYGPPMTLYNRWRRWHQQRIWKRIADEMRNEGSGEIAFVLEMLNEAPQRRRGPRSGRLTP